MKRIVSILLVLVLLMVCVAFAVTTLSMAQNTCDHTETVPPGQNYSTIITPAETEGAEPSTETTVPELSETMPLEDYIEAVG